MGAIQISIIPKETVQKVLHGKAPPCLPPHQPVITLKLLFISQDFRKPAGAKSHEIQRRILLDISIQRVNSLKEGIFAMKYAKSRPFQRMSCWASLS